MVISMRQEAINAAKLIIRALFVICSIISGYYAVTVFYKFCVENNVLGLSHLSFWLFEILMLPMAAMFILVNSVRLILYLAALIKWAGIDKRLPGLTF